MIKILITGDFCPRDRIEQLVLENKCEKIYNDFLPYLEDNEVNIANLECPLVNSNSLIPKTGPNLKAREECIKAFKYGNFNLLTLSNNHIMDQGEKGLNSTIDLCKNNNIEYIGAGKNLEEASRVLIKKINDRHFAFLNFSENEFSTAEDNHSGSNPLNPIKNYYRIKSARENADFVIVIVHGGHEGYSLPSPRMVDTYRFFIDAGADIVVGHHTHCFSGFEKYKGRLIFYSLGNFVFDNKNTKNTDWNYGYAVNFFFEKNKISFDIIPYKQCNENPGVFLLNEAEKQDFDYKLRKLNDTLNEESLLIKEWRIFSQKMMDNYVMNFESCNLGIYKSLRDRKLIPGFLSKKKKLLLLNLIRCESHRDLAIESLKIEKNIEL